MSTTETAAAEAAKKQLKAAKAATGTILAKEPFEHGGVAYGDGVHGGLGKALATAIVDAGHASHVEIVHVAAK